MGTGDGLPHLIEQVATPRNAAFCRWNETPSHLSVDQIPVEQHVNEHEQFRNREHDSSLVQFVAGSTGDPLIYLFFLQKFQTPLTLAQPSVLREVELTLVS